MLGTSTSLVLYLVFCLAGKEMKLDWVPPGVTVDLASRYLKSIPQEYLSIQVYRSTYPYRYTGVLIHTSIRSTYLYKYTGVLINI